MENIKDFEETRRDCYKLLIDRGFKLKLNGSLTEVTERLSARMGKTVHQSSLSNALTGYRTGPSSYDLLSHLKQMLTLEVSHRRSDGVSIHTVKNKSTINSIIQAI